MTEYTCNKCGAICEVVESGDHVAWAESWCDTCDDYPGGFHDGSPCPADEIGTDLYSARADRAYDEWKDEQLLKEANK